MSLFDKLLVAHLVGDWLLQTEWQALNKRRNLRALFFHVGVYSLIMLGILVMDFSYKNVEIYWMIGLIAFTHSLLDGGIFVVAYMKIFRLIDVREPERWLVMMVDQSMHILVLAIVALILTR